MTAVLVPVLVVTALLLVNAFFVASEFAIVAVPRPAIERRAAGGDWRARLVVETLRDPRGQDRFIATAQLGITLASLGLGMYGEHLIAEWLTGVFEGLGTRRWIAAHTLGSIVAIVFLTYLHIVIGEMVAKSIALQQAERTVLWIAAPMRLAQIVSHPVVVLLNGIGNGALRLMGINRQASSAEQFRTPEDLAYIIDEAQHGGLLRSEQARVVAELLDFGELTAGEVMVPRVRVIGIPLGADAAALRSTLRDHPFTRYPVYEESLDRIVGMLHVKDILRCLPTCTSLDRDLVRAIPFLPSTTSMDQVIAALRQARTQMAVVMDEHGGTAGILTVEDLFEEVVGDVSDEAQPHPEIVREANGCVRVRGTTRLEALSDALDVDLEREDVDTVSGLTLALLGGPPSVGDAVVFRHVRIEVTAVEGRGVAEVVARRG